MAKAVGMGSDLRGKVGQLVYYRIGEETFVRERPLTRKKPVRSADQMRQRMQWRNMISVWRQIKDHAQTFFEGRTSRAYNRFLSLNSKRAPVYLAKNAFGSTVVSDYQVSEGSLPTIEIEDRDGLLRTNISLGDLVIDRTTTVRDFSNAVLRQNLDFEPHDTLTYMLLSQKEGVMGTPLIEVKVERVELDRFDPTPLLLEGRREHFATLDGHLGTPTTIVGGQVWVRQRQMKKTTLVSTQNFVIHNPIVEQYRTVETLKQCADSYGGVNTGNDVDYVPNRPQNPYTSEEWDAMLRADFESCGFPMPSPKEEVPTATEATTVEATESKEPPAEEIVAHAEQSVSEAVSIDNATTAEAVSLDEANTAEATAPPPATASEAQAAPKAKTTAPAPPQETTCSHRKPKAVAPPPQPKSSATHTPPSPHLNATSTDPSEPLRHTNSEGRGEPPMHDPPKA